MKPDEKWPPDPPPPCEPAIPVGTPVRAKIPLVRPRPGETATVIGATPVGDLILQLPDTDIRYHAKPDHVEPDLDTDSF